MITIREVLTRLQGDVEQNCSKISDVSSKLDDDTLKIKADLTNNDDKIIEVGELVTRIGEQLQENILILKENNDEKIGLLGLWFLNALCPRLI